MVDPQHPDAQLGAPVGAPVGVPVGAPVVEHAAGTDAPHGRLAGLLGSRLYRAVGLVFLLAVIFSYFEPIFRVFMIGFVATILAIALNAIVTRIPLPRGLSIAIVVLTAVAMLAIGMWLLVSTVLTQVRALIADLPGIRASAEEWGRWLEERTGLDLQLFGPRLEGLLEELAGSVGSGRVLAGAFGVLELVAMVVIIFVSAIFLVSKPDEQLLTPIMRMVPPDRRPAYRRVFKLLGERIAGWIWGTLIAMVFVGVASGIAYWIIGVPYALLLAVLMGVLNVIPILGPWVAGAVAFVVALFHEPIMALWVSLAVLVVQEIESIFVRPMVMSGSVQVHPFVTIMTLLLFGSLFGLLGAILALPISLILGTMVEVLWVEETLGAQHDEIEPVVLEPRPAHERS